MECPKCKKKMYELKTYFGGATNSIACFNEKCWFYGIERIKR